jgi:hypothetical protein
MPPLRYFLRGQPMIFALITIDYWLSFISHAIIFDIFDTASAIIALLIS